MKPLTKRQQNVLEFIVKMQQLNGYSPTFRDIADHFGFRSMNAAADHVRALRKKGYIEDSRGRARFMQVLSPLQHLRKRLVDIPVFGNIPAGPPETRLQEAEACLTLDVSSLGIKHTAKTFALEVRGDSMIEKHIVDGDYVILEYGANPTPGDVVAALIDGASTLKTFVVEKGKPFLKAENPRYSKLIPAEELEIQGIMIGLVRKSGKA
ncbi:MAG: transcriptional repressor LexA [Verrucomicrobiota bacterium]|nr:transcriptional repressor LexA [Verrucomicrobiota bacterium]